MSDARAERRREQREARRFLRRLGASSSAVEAALEPGDEAIVFTPSGARALLWRDENEALRLRPVDEGGATAVAERWVDEEHAAEAVQ